MSQEPIDVRFIIESQGKPKEAVTKSLETLVEKLRTVQGVELYDTKYADVEANEQGLFSGLVDMGMRVDTFGKLTMITLSFGPSAIIVLGPDKIEIPNREVQNLLNDIANMLHDFTQANLKLKITNALLTRNKIVKSAAPKQLSTKPPQGTTTGEKTPKGSDAAGAS